MNGEIVVYCIEEKKTVATIKPPEANSYLCNIYDFGPD
jgi:hypothetical protein